MGCHEGQEVGGAFPLCQKLGVGVLGFLLRFPHLLLGLLQRKIIVYSNSTASVEQGKDECCHLLMNEIDSGIGLPVETCRDVIDEVSLASEMLPTEVEPATGLLAESFTL